MSNTIWAKFFWSDWSNDPALKLCSLAAQGLWMRMLCIAAESDPTGYVTVNGRPLNNSEIALASGTSESEAGVLLSELDRNGVFSRDRIGRIYSRRMVRDAKRHAIAQKTGKMGGNPNLCNNYGNSQEVKAPLKAPLNTQKPEASNQSPEFKKERKRVAPAEAERPRASRLSREWKPSEENIAYAKKYGFFDGEIARIADDFRDYWVSKPGQAGLKLDWNLTWNRWIRREADNYKKPKPSVAQIGFYARFGSAELDAWDAYGRLNKGSTYPKDKRGGWTFPARWPPTDALPCVMVK